MKVKTLALIAAIFLLGFILNTNAADKEYKCTIRNIYELSKSGEIDLVVKNVPNCFLFGSDNTFRILRNTGNIIFDKNCPPVSYSLFGGFSWERAKDAEGNFQADDPSTPIVDEAWIDNEGDYRIKNPEPFKGATIFVDEHRYQKEKPFSFYSIKSGGLVSGICL